MTTTQDNYIFHKEENKSDVAGRTIASNKVSPATAQKQVENFVVKYIPKTIFIIFRIILFPSHGWLGKMIQQRRRQWRRN